MSKRKIPGKGYGYGMTPAEKVRENRLRRKLDRMGYRLVKSKRKDPDSVGFGLYAVADKVTGRPVNDTARDLHSWTIADVERWITDRRVTK